jgi:hypothetical protein
MHHERRIVPESFGHWAAPARGFAVPARRRERRDDPQLTRATVRAALHAGWLTALEHEASIRRLLTNGRCASRTTVIAFDRNH